MDRTQPHLHISATPELRSPTLICAFAGWNDAAEIATNAVRFLIGRFGAVPCAEVDPEEFFVFTELRPQVSIDEGSQRRIDWPKNEFFFHSAADEKGRDCIMFVGTEPHLRWRTFVDVVLNHATRLNASLVVTLGGLLADVPHTRAPRLTGSATDPYYAERLGRLNVRSSRYEGPTGIAGVLNQACRQRSLAAVSLWGNVPHYINSTPNPKVTAALLRRLDALLELDLDVAELDEAGIRFDAQIAEAIGRDPEAQSYVRKLEDRDEHGDEDLHPDTPSDPEARLPSGEELVRELEEFLRRPRDDEAR